MDLQNELYDKRGTSSVLVQSVLQESWWSEAMECYCYLQNVQDLHTDGQTVYERRFKSSFEGPLIPFGAEVKFYPISSEDQGRVHLFGTKVLAGIFIGYSLKPGKKLDRWSFDNGFGGSGNNATMRTPCKKDPNQKKEKLSKRNDEFVLPCKTGEILQEGQPLSTAIYKAGIDPTRESQQHCSDREGRSPKSRSIICRNHVAPRLKLFVP